MQEQKDMKDWKQNCMLKSLLHTLASWHKWVYMSPFSPPSGGREFSAFWSQHVLSPCRDSHNCGNSFIKLQSPCTHNLPPYSELGHLQPSAFRDYAPVLFSNIQVCRKPLLSTGSLDSIRKLMQILILYLSSLVHCISIHIFLFLKSYSCYYGESLPKKEELQQQDPLTYKIIRT